MGTIQISYLRTGSPTIANYCTCTREWGGEVVFFSVAKTCKSTSVLSSLSFRAMSSNQQSSVRATSSLALTRSRLCIPVGISLNAQVTRVSPSAAVRSDVVLQRRNDKVTSGRILQLSGLNPWACGSGSPYIRVGFCCSGCSLVN